VYSSLTIVATSKATIKTTKAQQTITILQELAGSLAVTYTHRAHSEDRRRKHVWGLVLLDTSMQGMYMHACKSKDAGMGSCPFQLLPLPREADAMPWPLVLMPCLSEYSS
jgi:hypothetical protein